MVKDSLKRAYLLPKSLQVSKVNNPDAPMHYIEDTKFKHAYKNKLGTFSSRLDLHFYKDGAIFYNPGETCIEVLHQTKEGLKKIVDAVKRSSI